MLINGNTNRIHVYGSSGELLQTNFGNRLLNKRFNTPTLITELPNSRVAVFDSHSKKILKLSFSEDLVDTYNIGLATYCLSANRYGHMVMAHQKSKTEREISIRSSENGYIIHTISIPRTVRGVVESPIYSIYNNQDSNIVALDPLSCKILVMNLNGAILSQIGREGFRLGEMENPRSLCLDAQNQIIVADTKNNRIVRFHSGNSNRSEVLLQEVYRPLAVAFDACDQLVVMTAKCLMIFNYKSSVIPTAPPMY